MKKIQDFKKMVAILLILSMLLGLAGCTTYDNFVATFVYPTVDETPVIKIGVFEPLTGADAQAAANELKGIELAHETYPTLGDYRIDLVYGDNESDVNTAKTIAQSLIEQGVSIVLGSYKSVLTLAGSDVFKLASLPAITISCQNPIITQTNPFYARVCYIDSFEGSGAADYIVNELGYSNAAIILKEGNDYSSAIAEGFEKAMYEETGSDTSVMKVIIPSGITNFAGILNSINQSLTSGAAVEEAETEAKTGAKAGAKTGSKDSAKNDNKNDLLSKAVAADINAAVELADDVASATNVTSESAIPGPAIFLPESIEYSLEIIKQSKDLGYNFSFIGTKSWNELTETVSKEMLPYMEGISYTMDYDPKALQSDETKKFITLYNTTFNESITNNQDKANSMALGYDAYLLALEALKNAEDITSGESIMEALTKVNGLEGATGTIRINSQGDPIKNVLIEQFKDNAVKLVYTAIPDWEEQEN